MSDRALLTAKFSGIDLINDYVSKYGERGKAVLLCAIEAMLEEDRTRANKLGDFDYRGVKGALARRGMGFRLHTYLRALEREYGLIHQTYKSSKQNWWAFTDRELVIKWYEEERERLLIEPRIKALLAKFKLLKADDVLRRFERLASKGVLSDMERRDIREFAFNSLDSAVTLLEEMEKYGEVFDKEIAVIKRLIDIIYLLSSKV